VGGGFKIAAQHNGAGLDIPRNHVVADPARHDVRPQAALIAECFTGRLRYSGASIGYQLASVFAGGPAPLIATALFAEFRSGYAIALYILVCAVISFAAALLLPDDTNRDISQECDRPEGLTARS
jgi:hypothetical protein